MDEPFENNISNNDDGYMNGIPHVEIRLKSVIIYLCIPKMFRSSIQTLLYYWLNIF